MENSQEPGQLQVLVNRRAEAAITRLSPSEKTRVYYSLLLFREFGYALPAPDVNVLPPRSSGERLFLFRADESLRVLFTVEDSRAEIVDVVRRERLDALFGNQRGTTP